MVAREDAQMVSRLVAQAVVAVCVEPHKYGGATAKVTRDLENNAAPVFCPFTCRMTEVNNRTVHWCNQTLLHTFTSHSFPFSFVNKYVLGFGRLQVLAFQHHCSINLLFVNAVQS